MLFCSIKFSQLTEFYLEVRKLRKSKRILSFMMAMLMLASTFSIMANAAASYKDAGIPASAYNDVDQPSFTIDQCSSMTLDYADIILAKQNMIIDLSVLGTLNLTSVNNALDGIYGLLNSAAFKLFGSLLGDLKDLQPSAIATARRVPATANADTTVIYQLLQFLSDNQAIFVKVVDGSLNLGIASSFVDLSKININQMVKGMLFGMAYPTVTKPTTITTTADQMVQDIITGLIVGTTDKPGLFPALAGHIDIVGSTAVAYDFGEQFLRDIYNIVLVPLLNTDFKKLVREVCGVVYDDSVNFPNGDASHLNSYADILNIDFVVPTHTFASGATLVSDLNNIFAELIGAITKGYTGWVAGDNTNALNNLANAIKYVLSLTGNKFFKDYVAVATPAQINAMTNEQLFSYLIRSVLNSYIDTMNIPSDADSLVKVAWYAIKEVLAEKVPQNSYTVSAYPQTLDGILNMLGDLAVYFINQTMDMNTTAGTLPGTGLLAYGQTFDVTLTAIMAWVKTNYGGMLNVTLSGTDGWADLNTLVTAVIPSNWISGFTTVKALFKTQVLQSILDLNTTPLFALFNHVAGNDLATKTIKKVLLERFATILNLIFPAAVPLTYTTFDQLIDNANLKTIMGGVFTQLNTRKAAIMPVILPLLDSSIGYSTPQAYQNPTLMLPNCISATTTFPIRNDSTGVNTGATNKAGTFSQDALYKIKIVSIASSIPAITPTDLRGTVINGGDAVNCTLSGTFAANQTLMVTVTYDVYTELGAKLTTQPLTAMAFSYISAVVDDGTLGVTVDSNSNNYHTMKYFNTYMSYGSAPVEPVLPPNPTPAQTAKYNTDHAQWVIDLANYTTDKNASMASLSTAAATLSRASNPTLGTQGQAATVTRGTATVDANLVANGITAAAFTTISTTGDGGTWIVPYYTVSATPTRPADGLYSSNFSFTAGKTSIFYGSETFTIPHKVVLYNDFGLPGLLSSEINAKRDPTNYSGGAAGAEWQNYIAALESAVAVQYRPRQASTFMNVQGAAYEGTAQDLKDAITALDATQVSTGVTTLKTAMDTVQPPNAAGLSYDDPAYNYFGMADYVPYTYLRYTAQLAIASSLYQSQQPPVEPVLGANPTPDEVTAFNAAHAQWVIDLATFNATRVNLKPVDVAYALWKLNLYAGRLIPVQAVKTQLSADLTRIQGLNLVQGQYSTLTWTAYQKALAFAVSVNAQSATATDGSGNFVLRQTKVDTARTNLITAAKQLITVANYTQLDSYIHQAQALVSGDYTPASWAILETALTAALAVAREMSNIPANQAIIDAAAAALKAALDGLQILAKNPLIAIAPHTPVIDLKNLWLYNLGLGSGAHGYVTNGPGYSIVFHDTSNGPGTGSTVEAVLSGVSTFFNVVIYGDINGDANIDSIDAGVAVDAENYMITLTPVQLKAGDVNKDGNTDSIDAGMMVDCENYMITIPQS
jgi:hypothetical protein